MMMDLPRAAAMPPIRAVAVSLGLHADNAGTHPFSNKLRPIRAAVIGHDDFPLRFYAHAMPAVPSRCRFPRFQPHLSRALQQTLLARTR